MPSTLTTLTPTPDGARHLLHAVQKLRSIAAEGGYADLLEDSVVGGIPIKGLDWFVGNDKTVTILAEFAHGERSLDASTWFNYASIAATNHSIGVALAARGVQMPDPLDALAQFED